MKIELKRRIIITLTLTFGVLYALSGVVLYGVLGGSFKSLGHQNAEEHMTRLVNAVHYNVDNLDMIVRDWAGWDSTYEFVVDQNQEYAESNLVPATLIFSKLNFLAIYDLDGKSVWQLGLDLEEKGPIEIDKFPRAGLTKDHILLRHTAEDSRIVGLYPTGHGAMLIASRPILTSNNEGPIRGSLVMGRFLTQDIAKGLSDRIRLPLEFWLVGSESVPDEVPESIIQGDEDLLIVDTKTDILNVYAVIRDIFERPYLILRSTLPEKLALEGMKAINLALLLMGVMGIVLLTVSLAMAHHITVFPLRSIIARFRQSDDDSQAAEPAAFFKRIPEELGVDLVCLEMEDHYVRVHTAQGNGLILMRMRDAVAELEGFDGMQVHRSYWVAREAIVSTQRDGERALLTLSNGMEIPVSRTRLRQLRELGFIEI